MRRAALAEVKDDLSRFLRLAENRLQALHDQQTHDLPGDPADQVRLAAAMGCADWQQFLAALQVQRDAVARHFRAIVFRGMNPTGEGNAEESSEPGPAATAPGDLDRVWTEPADPDVQEGRLAAAGFAAPEAVAECVRRLREGGLQRRLDEPGRHRLDALVPAILRSASRQARSSP